MRGEFPRCYSYKLLGGLINSELVATVKAVPETVSVPRQSSSPNTNVDESPDRKMVRSSDISIIKEL